MRKKWGCRMIQALVIDANVLFSALLAKGTTRSLLFNSHLKLYAPEYLIDELSEHLHEDDELRKKLNQTKEETDIVIDALLKTVDVIPLEEYRACIKQALETCPDEDDTPYFALAMHLKIPLWSNDAKLKKQESVKVLNTGEVLKLVAED